MTEKDNKDLNRTPRSADTRADKVARKPWSPPSKLDAPAAPEGYTNRWIRAETVGVEDRGNISDRLSEGFELVRFEELDESDKKKYIGCCREISSKFPKFEIGHNIWCIQLLKI